MPQIHISLPAKKWTIVTQFKNTLLNQNSLRRGTGVISAGLLATGVKSAGFRSNGVKSAGVLHVERQEKERNFRFATKG